MWPVDALFGDISSCHLYEHALYDFTDNWGENKHAVSPLLFSVVWSVGGTLDGPSRLKFDEFFRGVCDGEGSHAKYPR